MTDATNLVLLAKLGIRDTLNHKLLMANYFVPLALVVNITVNVMLEIRVNPLNPCHPCSKNGLAQRGNAVAIW
jgi:hypothetical protein